MGAYCKVNTDIVRIYKSEEKGSLQCVFFSMSLMATRFFQMIGFVLRLPACYFTFWQHIVSKIVTTFCHIRIHLFSLLGNIVSTHRASYPSVASSQRSSKLVLIKKVG